MPVGEDSSTLRIQQDKSKRGELTHHSERALLTSSSEGSILTSSSEGSIQTSSSEGSIQTSSSESSILTSSSEGSILFYHEEIRRGFWAGDEQNPMQDRGHNLKACRKKDRQKH